MSEILKRKNRIVILAPHTDDGEFGCGGTIARFLEEGSDVHYVAFSAAERSVPEGWERDTLRKEVREATAILGIPSANLSVLNYDVRNFPEVRQQILEDMIVLNKDLQPDIVFLPSTSDTHQDHRTVSEEGFRAFKKTTILGYELPWNNLQFQTSSFVQIEERHLKLKIDALKAYRSQYHRSYATEEFVRSMAIMRGVTIDSKFAESFQVVRWIMR